MKTKILEKRNLYITQGKKSLEDAIQYLKDNCDDWSLKHEVAWQNLIKVAEVNLAMAKAMDVLIEEDV